MRQLYFSILLLTVFIPSLLRAQTGEPQTGVAINKAAPSEGFIFDVNGLIGTQRYGVRLAPLPAPPQLPVPGMIYYDTQLAEYRSFDGSAWSSFTAFKNENSLLTTPLSVSIGGGLTADAAFIRNSLSALDGNLLRNLSVGGNLTVDQLSTFTAGEFDRLTVNSTARIDVLVLDPDDPTRYSIFNNGRSYFEELSIFHGKVTVDGPLPWLQVGTRSCANCPTDEFALSFANNSNTRNKAVVWGNLMVLPTGVPDQSEPQGGFVFASELALQRGINTTDYRLLPEGVWNERITRTSDRRLKQEVRPIDSALDKALSLNGVTYRWNQTALDRMVVEDQQSIVRGPDQTEAEFITHLARQRNLLLEEKDVPQVGLIAQDVRSVLPMAVEEDDDGYLRVDYDVVSGLLVEALKEQQTIIEAQEERIRALEAQQSSVLARLETLEARGQEPEKVRAKK